MKNIESYKIYRRSCLVSLLLISIILLFSCTSEDLKEEENTIQKFQDLFSLNKFKNSGDLKSGSIEIKWDEYIIRKNSLGLVHEFNIDFKRRSIFNLDGYSYERIYKLLVINDNDVPQFYIVELLPSISNKNVIISYLDNEGYSGMAYIFNLLGEQVSSEYYEYGELQTKSILSIEKDPYPRIPQKCAILEGLEPVSCTGGSTNGCTTSQIYVDSWTYWYDVEIDTYTGVIISSTYSHREFNGRTIRQVTNCDGGGSQVADGSTVISRTNGAILPDGTEDDESFWLFTLLAFGEKINPVEELKCFNPNQSAKLTIYVQQPKENTDEIIGPNEVGHAFIGIEQNGVKRQFGFYPESNANSIAVGVGTTYDSELRDNNDYLYHVSISKQVTPSQLQAIIKYSKEFPSKYNVNSFACVDFAIEIAKKGGLNLPRTTVSSFTFSGRSPGQLGQEIRSMSSNGTVTVTKNKNQSPKKEGDCQ